MKKKLFAMALCLLMVVAMAVPAFAETFRATPPYFSASTYYYSVNSAKALNAYTEGTPVNGTNVTTYMSTGSITQEWIATQFPGEDRYSVRVGTSSSANPLVLCLGANGNCELRYTSNTTVENYKVKFIAEPNGVYGIALVNRPNWVALTESSVQTVGGHNVVWQPSSGLNNQLWRGVLVYD